MTPLEITLLILVLTIVAFITGKIPFSVISAGIMLSLIMTGVMEPAEAFSGFINTNVVMVVAMFVMYCLIAACKYHERDSDGCDHDLTSGWNCK